jgi:4'-phosphopantetheinyl transferase EntD
MDASLRALGVLFPDASYVTDVEVRLADEELLPEERAVIQGAVPKRRAEFATARVCVRAGLAAMGMAPAAIVPADQGRPVWPAGVTGSISHTGRKAAPFEPGGTCAVVLYRSPPVRSVGLDVEMVQDLEPAIADLIMTPGERAWLRVQSAALQASLPLVFFSAKEAYYKCQYPISRTFLDFTEAELEVFPENGRFVARGLRPGLPGAIAELEGRYAFEDGRLFSGVVLR